MIEQLDAYIGDLSIDSIHQGCLTQYVETRRKEVKTRTVNYGLQVVRHILNLAASEWVDEQGLTWLITAPKIRLLTEIDKLPPYPISWEEQARLFDVLPTHLKAMALFAVNTGCRDREICQLRWVWEVPIAAHPEWLVFLIPGQFVKNTDDRLVVCNRVACQVVESQRGKHPTHVFSFRGTPIYRMNNSGWQKARKKVGLPQVRVHDLKHTFGRRLRAAGVSFEDRQDLLGHRSGRITTHYSAAELQNLYDAANKVCSKAARSSVIMTLVRSFVNQADDNAEGRRALARVGQYNREEIGSDNQVFNG